MEVKKLSELKFQVGTKPAFQIYFPEGIGKWAIKSFGTGFIYNDFIEIDYYDIDSKSTDYACGQFGIVGATLVGLDRSKKESDKWHYATTLFTPNKRFPQSIFWENLTKTPGQRMVSTTLGEVVVYFPSSIGNGEKEYKFIDTSIGMDYSAIIGNYQGPDGKTHKTSITIPGFKPIPKLLDPHKWIDSIGTEHLIPAPNATDREDYVKYLT